MEKQKETRRYPKQLVLVPYPAQGHMSAMLNLGTLLHSLGFSITIAHPLINSPDPLNHPDFNFQPISGDLSGHNTSIGNLLALTMTLNSDCGTPLKECLVQIKTEHEPNGDRIACVIYDTMMYFAEDVANQMKVPSIVLQTCSASYILPCRLLGQLKAEGCIPSQDHSMNDLVPKLHPLRFSDLPVPEPDDFLLRLLVTLSNVGSSLAIIWNTEDHLEHQPLSQLRQHYKVPIFPLGPLQKMAPSSSTSFLKEENSCIDWLEKQSPKSVIYVSFGSIANLEPNELVEMAWGLANCGQPFLWVVRPRSVKGSEWIEHLPEGFREVVEERGSIVKWAPQKKVLAHWAVGGFWSHCGWNSSLESISEGVPMICKPCFGDQRVNARYLTHVWRVGLELEDELERGAIQKAVRRLMTDKEGEEIRRRAIDMKKTIEVSIKKGGSSYNYLIELADFISDFHKIGPC